MEQQQAWERQPNETSKAWEAFQAYRDLGRDRTQVRAAEILGKGRRTIENWATIHNWVERVRLYDIHLDRLNRLDWEKSRREEYARKIENYRSDCEQVGRSLVNTGVRVLQSLQREINRRLAEPENLRPGEIAQLLRASAHAIDIGSKLQSEALGIDNLVGAIADEQSRN